MANITFDGLRPARRAGLPDALRRWLDLAMEARSRQAARRLATFLLSHGELDVAAHGFHREELKRIGSTAYPL